MTKTLSPWCKRAKIKMIACDISTNELAQTLGYNRSYISSVLNGRTVNQPVRNKISSYLGISNSDKERD